MRLHRGLRRSLALIALFVVAVACGGSNGSVLDSGSATGATGSGTGQDPNNSGQTMDASEVLSDALADLDEAHGYRITSTSAQTLRSSALGINQKTELDPARPTSIVEIATDGSTHTFLDLGVVLGAAFSADPTAAEAIDQTSIDLWQVGDSFVIDSRGYQAIVDLNPAADLGPFTPGIGVVDLTRLGELGSQELVQALTGTSIVDPRELARQLAGSLTDVRPHPIDDNTFTARATYAVVLEALGNDVEITTRSAATGFAQSLSLSIDEVAGFYQRFYESNPTDVTFALDDDGSLKSISIRSDLSSLYSQLFSEDAGIDLGATKTELAEARAAFADTEFLIESFTTFEIDDSIVVTPPTGNFEDRTELALKLMSDIVPNR